MIEFDVVITREYADKESVARRIEKGWTFVATLPAKTVHPYALESDKATIFSKYKAPIIPEDVPEANSKEAE
ncbi:hypothetical protein [Bacillus haynesii]|uniref:hypothetical protein n=1 Tax=Bacillus haynesii TaxID=1925021 RepID=UPI00227E04EF|nr:hypothetical protein [Bacillus haynesii]MCY9274576.1 hypothetical protein [Bacillus haynesii]